MRIWLERALAALRWGWGKLVSAAKWAWAKVVVLGNTIYDPPPVAYKRLFFTALALFLAGGLTFAFVNSWFYKPTAQFFTSLSQLGDDGDVELPKLEPLPPVPITVETLPVVPGVEVVCHDMSDTPHCEPVKDSKVIEVTANDDKLDKLDKPSLKPKAKKRRAVKKPVRIETYWGF